MTKSTHLKDVTEAVKGVVESVTLPKETVVAASEKPASELGNGLSNLIYLIFSPLEKKRIAAEADIERYRNEIQSELSKVPEDKRIEPPVNIIGPALEASKYYIDEDNIRLMFSKLIASSSNVDYKDYALPAFVEILKQLSPFDAVNLKTLFKLQSKNDGNLLVSGTIRITLSADSDVGRDVLTNFIPFENLNSENRKLYSASVDNLIRLGLIYIKPNYKLVEDLHQKALLKHPIYEWAVNEHERNMDKDPFYKPTHIKMINGVWNFTDFGSLFAKCCIREA